jgi:hypothetical protein
LKGIPLSELPYWVVVQTIISNHHKEKQISFVKDGEANKIEVY